ncbi:MAG: adhesin, partial [Candidatus Accumulibacter sp.]|nr:adhesin [Accumulibacter sp.]
MLVRDQILQLTGRQFLNGYGDAMAQIDALLTNGALLAQSLQLAPGLGLSAAQANALTQNMAIMELREVAGQQVWVPVVYLARNSVVTDQGALIAGRDIALDNLSAFDSKGLIKADNNLALGTQADRSLNISGGLESGGAMSLTTAGSGDINLLSTQLKAGQLFASAGGNLNLETLTDTRTVSSFGANRSITEIGPLASIEVAGNASIRSGGDLNQKGATISVGGNADLKVAGDWNLDTVQSREVTSAQRRDGNSHTEVVRNTGSTVDIKGRLIAEVTDLNARGAQIATGTNSAIAAENIRLSAAVDETKVLSDSRSSRHSETKDIQDQRLRGSSISADGNLVLHATQNIELQASAIQATGNLGLSAAGSVTLGSQTEAHLYDSTHVGMKSNLLSSKTKTEADTVDQLFSVGSVISGKNVVVAAGNDISVKGSHIDAEADTTLLAGRDVSIV